MPILNREWSLDIKPNYDEPSNFTLDGGAIFTLGPATINSLRVAIKSGPKEVVVFYAVRPEPSKEVLWGPEADYILSYSAMEPPGGDGNTLNLNPLVQLLDDAELGRRVREAGLGVIDETATERYQNRS